MRSHNASENSSVFMKKCRKYSDFDGIALQKMPPVAKIKKGSGLLRCLLSVASPVITCTLLAGGLPPTCFTASNFQPQNAAGRPANHALIRHPE